MTEPILTIDERAAINAGRWFSSLSPSLRHDILRCTYVRRYKDGDLISAKGWVPPVDGYAEASARMHDRCGEMIALKLRADYAALLGQALYA